MSLRNVGIVYRKELRESLRDRRTLTSMIVVPILIMPLLTIGVGVVMTKIVGSAQDEVANVMVVGGQDSPQVLSALDSAKGIHVVPFQADYVQRISNKKLRAAVEIPAGFDASLQQQAAGTVKIYNYKGDLKSGFASQKLENFFRDYRDRAVRQNLQSRNLPQNLTTPFSIEQQNVASAQQVGGEVIGGILPYFIIILCLTGAMYPAMDLTAGEKERGTIETILCSPVSRVHLVLGKFLTVLTASLCSGLLSLISMGVSFQLAKQFLNTTAKGDSPFNFSIGLPTIAIIFLMVVPLAVLFAAGLLAIALCAKSYKEAQSYISPLMIVVIMPAVIGMLPGVEMSARMSIIPVLNTSLICKEIATGTYHWNSIFTILISTSVYAAAALFIAVKLFQREDVLFRT
jgi:sodium transport system permease protein